MIAILDIYGVSRGEGGREGVREGREEGVIYSDGGWY